MSRLQLALRVADLEASVAFYSKLFGTEPAKRRPGYANFAIAEPPLKLVLIRDQTAQTARDDHNDQGGQGTRLDHLGVEVQSTGQVTAASARLRDAGLAPAQENGTSCCYARQDTVWVTGPGAEPWEVYVVTGDADTLTKAEDSLCCAPSQDQTTQQTQKSACC